MPTYSLFSGNGPSTGTAYATGDLVEGVNFQVTQGGLWWYGYRQWILPSVQAVTGYKYAAYQITGVDASSPSAGGMPGTVVSQGAAFTPGAWNTTLLAVPLLLAPAFTSDAIALTYGAAYHACVGQPAAAWGAFPETKNQFGATDPLAAGITNGPLVGFSSLSGSLPVGGDSQWLPQMAFTTSIADPASGMPTQNDSDANLWIDILLSTVPPAGASYRMLPNMPAFNVPGAGPQTGTYTLGTEFTLSQACTGNYYWHYSAPGCTALPQACCLWLQSGGQVPGSLVSAPSWSGAAGSGWISCPYPGGTIPAGNYIASAFGSGEWFLAQTNWWTTAFPSGITQGPIEFTGTNVFIGGTGLTQPNDTLAEFDGFDFQVTPASSGGGSTEGSWGGVSGPASGAIMLGAARVISAASQTLALGNEYVGPGG